MVPRSPAQPVSLNLPMTQGRAWSRTAPLPWWLVPRFGDACHHARKLKSALAAGAALPKGYRPADSLA